MNKPFNKTLLAIACLSASLFALPRAGASTLTEPGVIIMVADPGNQPDTTGFGAVGYTYAISKYEVSISQYADFLNSIATLGDPHGLYNPSMATDLNVAGIERTGSGSVGSPYNYTVIGSGDRPSGYGTFDQLGNLGEWNDLTGLAAAENRGVGGYPCPGQARAAGVR